MSAGLRASKEKTEGISLGSTPTTTYDRLPSAMDLPTISGSPPNERRHRSWLSITTRFLPGASSEARKLRPRSGCTPSTSKRLAETRKPVRTCAPGSFTSVGSQEEMAAIPANERLSRFQSTKVAYEVLELF